MDQINRAVERMSKLDTSPGLLIGRNENHPITADVVVEAGEDDGYIVRLKDTQQLNLRVNSFYEKMSRNRGVDDQTRQVPAKEHPLGAVVHGCHPAAKTDPCSGWPRRSFAIRPSSLLRASSISNPCRWPPLLMRWASTWRPFRVPSPANTSSARRAVLPLRSFFSGGLEDENGTERSWDAVKAKLQEIIDNEDKSKPLSDDALKQKTDRRRHGRNRSPHRRKISQDSENPNRPFQKTLLTDCYRRSSHESRSLQLWFFR